MLTNQLSYIDPHLFIRLKGLLKIVALGPLIIEDGEGQPGWLGAAVPSSDDGIMVGVVLPLAAFPPKGQLVGEG